MPRRIANVDSRRYKAWLRSTRPPTPDPPFSPPSMLQSHIATLNNLVNIHPPLNFPSDPLRLPNLPETDFLLLRAHLDSLIADSVGCSKSLRLNYESSTDDATLSHSGLPEAFLLAFTERILALFESQDLAFYGDVWKHDESHRIISTKCASIALWLGTPIRQPHGSLTLKGEDAPFLACEVIDDSVDSLRRVELALNYLTESVRVLVLVKLERAGDVSGVGAGDKVPRTSDSGAIKKSEEEEEEEEEAEQDAAGGENAPGTITAPDHRRPVYSRGLFWVYTSSFRGPERNFVFTYYEAGIEFYPTPPTTHLTLSWSSINRPRSVDPIPSHVADKSISIPWAILHEMFVELVQPELPGPGE